MRKRSFHSVASALVAVGMAVPHLYAQEPVDLHADLDHDGKIETITFEKFAETEEEGAFYQIIIMDDDGMTPLWNGPQTTDLTNPLVFGSWHHGISFPEVAMDIDNDGYIELVAPAPAGDVSPTLFQVYRWKAGRLLLGERGVLLEAPHGSGKFPWSDTDRWQGTWISGFEGKAGDGSIAVRAISYDGGSSNPLTGVARVQHTGEGYKVLDWIESLADNSETPAYNARLSRKDHFNSKGIPLKQVIDVLRQDRANFHSGNDDTEDRDDYFFNSLEGRNQMSNMRVIPVGKDHDSWTRDILYGTPLVEVKIDTEALYVEIVEP